MKVGLGPSFPTFVYGSYQLSSVTQDIDDTDKNRWCEYILYRGLTRLGYARISHGGLSDTEVQQARFRIPAAGEQAQDNRAVTTSARNIPATLHFTDRCACATDKLDWVTRRGLRAAT